MIHLESDKRIKAIRAGESSASLPRVAIVTQVARDCVRFLTSGLAGRRAHGG